MSEARFRLLRSSLHLPLMALDKAQAQASWLVQDPVSLREGGAEHLIIFAFFAQSWSKSDFLE